MDEFHHQVGVVVYRIKIIDLNDIGMAQFGNDPCFAFEALQLIGIFLIQVAEDLDGHLAFEGGVRAQIDLCDAPSTDQRSDLNLPERFPYPTFHPSNYTQSLVFNT